jgi:uncharacterized damage-inducible protein DinB
MFGLSLSDLLEYTNWERHQWLEWLRKQGDGVLETSAGPHGDGRLQTVGDVVRHIFGAEKRYIEWLSGRHISELTNWTSIPNNNIEALFEFGQQSRTGLKEFIESYPPQSWNDTKDLRFTDLHVVAKATPSKIVIHVLMHEIRHWAQIATLFRLNGLPSDFHDFIASPVMGGEWRREHATA